MNRDLRKKLAYFFTKVRNPSDKKIHKFAEKLGIEPDELEEEIYGLLSSFFAYGKYNENHPEKVNMNELKKGIKIEMEHTNCSIIAKRVALDHLAESPEYYSKLEDMEKEMEIEEKIIVDEKELSLEEQLIKEIKAKIRILVKEVIEEKAPPGMEDIVKALKKDPNIDNPYAVAWAQYNDKKKENESVIFHPIMIKKKPKKGK